MPETKTSKLKSDKGGFTLLELTVAITLWMIVLVSATQMLLHVSRASYTVMSRQNKLESARIAIDKLETNVQMADEIILITGPGHMLRHVTLYQIDYKGDRHDFQFRFDATLPYYDTRHGRLEIGSNNVFNEVSSHLGEVRMIMSEDRRLLHIIVSTDEDDPVTFTSTVDIRYKD